MYAIASHSQVESLLSFHAVCGSEECGRCGPQLRQMSFAIWLAYLNGPKNNNSSYLNF